MFNLFSSAIFFLARVYMPGPGDWSPWFKCPIFHAIVLASSYTPTPIAFMHSEIKTHGESAITGSLPHVLASTLLHASMDTEWKNSQRATSHMAESSNQERRDKRVCTKAYLVLYLAEAHKEVQGRSNASTRYESHPSYTTMREACFELSRLHSPNRVMEATCIEVTRNIHMFKIYTNHPNGDQMSDLKA
jgi:hypothetical protein